MRTFKHCIYKFILPRARFGCQVSGGPKRFLVIVRSWLLFYGQACYNGSYPVAAKPVLKL